MRKRLLTIAFVMLFSLIAVNTTMAATDVDNFVVTATVGLSCRITAVTGVSFGLYDPTDPTDLAAAGDISFRCVQGTSYDLYITGTRSMSSVNSGDTLNFELYTDAAHGTVFPSALPGVSSPVVSNAVQTTNVFGLITNRQDVGQGNDYTVTLIATIEY